MDIIPAKGVSVAQSMLELALSYAELGWYVFPLHTPNPEVKNGCSCNQGQQCRAKQGPSPGKHPHLRWSTNATTDPFKIEQWWRTWPDANIGIALKQSRLAVLDIDPRNGGHLTWESLVETLGPLPETLQVLTGAWQVGEETLRGRHIYIVHPSLKMPSTVDGIDIKLSGYIVAPGSLHFSGVRYEAMKALVIHSMPLKWIDGLRARARQSAKRAAHSGAAAAVIDSLVTGGSLVTESSSLVTEESFDFWDDPELPSYTSQGLLEQLGELDWAERRHISYWQDKVISGDWTTAKGVASASFSYGFTTQRATELAYYIALAAYEQNRWHSSGRWDNFATMVCSVHHGLGLQGAEDFGAWRMKHIETVQMAPGIADFLLRIEKPHERAIAFINLHNAALRQQLHGESTVELPLHKQAEYGLLHRKDGRKLYTVQAGRIRKRLLIDAGILTSLKPGSGGPGKQRVTELFAYTPLEEFGEGLPTVSAEEVCKAACLLPISPQLLRDLKRDYEEPIPKLLTRAFSEEMGN